MYAKARATIEQKLVTANASQAVAIRQRNILEDAITEVEAFYAPPAEAPAEPVGDALEDFLHEANQDAAPSGDADEGAQDSSDDETGQGADDEPPFSTEPREKTGRSTAPRKRPRPVAANISSAPPRRSSVPTRA